MLLDFLVNAAITATFLLHSFILGYAVLCRLHAFGEIDENNNGYLTVFFSLSLGISINILVLMLLGFLGVLEALFVGLTGVGVLCVAGIVLRAWFIRSRSITLEGVIWTFLLFLLTLVFAWHAPGHWDDTSFHLPLARFYVEREAIVLHEYVRFPLFPQNMNMLIALGLILGDVFTAQIFATLPWFVIGLGLMGFCKWQVGSSLLGVVIALALVKWVGVFTAGFGYAYVDVGLAMFCWAAVVALVFFYERWRVAAASTIAWVAIAGLLAGAAAGTKLFGGVLALIVFVHILIITRSLKLGVFFCFAVLSFGIWWYVRSYIISGDPFHPAGGKYFGYFLWNENDLSSQVSAQNSLGTSGSLWELFSVLKEVGADLWVLAFVGLFFKGVPKTLRIMQSIFVIYFFFWFFVAQIERYLAPIAVLGTFLSFYTVFLLLALLIKKTKLPKIKSPYLLLGGQLLVLAFGLNMVVKEVQFGIKEPWADKLKTIHGYELFSRANELAPHSERNLVQLGFENAAYFFNGIVIGDWFGSARYSQMLNCTDKSCQVLDELTMEQLLIHFDSKMLVVSLLRYPDFNPENYRSRFDVVFSNSQGVLLRLKK